MIGLIYDNSIGICNIYPILHYIRRNQNIKFVLIEITYDLLKLRTTHLSVTNPNANVWYKSAHHFRDLQEGARLFMGRCVVAQTSEELP